MQNPEFAQPDDETVSKLLDHVRVRHNYSDPNTLQWCLVAAYDRAYPEMRCLEQLQREARRSREVLRELVAGTLFGRDWRTGLSITEALVLNTRYSRCSSPENLAAAQAEIERRCALDPDFERRRKNAEHRSQERQESVKNNRLLIFIANNWTNPAAPLWMAGVADGALMVRQGLMQDVKDARFKTIRDRCGFRSFPKRPFRVPRWQNFAVKPLELTTEAKKLVRELEEMERKKD